MAQGLFSLAPFASHGDAHLGNQTRPAEVTKRPFAWPPAGVVWFTYWPKRGAFAQYVNQNGGPLPARAQRGPLVQALTRANPWWTQPQWQAADPQLLAAQRAPFDWTPRVLADAYLVVFLFQESGGVPDIRRQRKVYPVDPFLAHLPARRAPGAAEPEPSRLAEAALAAAIFRAVEGDAVDRFGEPERLFYYRSPNGAEVDFVVPAFHGGSGHERRTYAAESKYVDAVTGNDSKAMAVNFGEGLLLTRGAIDLQQQVPGVTTLPAALFTWLLDQPS